jgi:hypothetical protein
LIAISELLGQSEPGPLNQPENSANRLRLGIADFDRIKTSSLDTIYTAGGHG